MAVSEANSTVDATPNFTHYVSIDFGTSGCGIAMAIKGNTSDIKVFSSWEGMTNVDTKCPTVLLLDPDKKFEQFGIKAMKAMEAKSNLKQKDKADDYLFFRKFKMCLYDNPEAKEIKAMNGTSVPLIDVFVHSLKCIREYALEGLRKNFSNPGRKIQWIITVPAIWTPAAKQFMRKAAVQAGFDERSLVFALEPEAAALFCLQDVIQIKNVPEASYLVVDCGGGTIDIAAHKMIIKNKGIKDKEEIFIEELSPPDGGDYGGFAVNQQFEHMLQDIFSVSNEQFDCIKEKCSRQWFEMVWKTFEESKCNIQPGKEHESISIPIHKSIREEVRRITEKSIEDLVNAYKKNSVEWDSDEDGIVLPYSTIYNLYNPILVQITSLINTVLSKPSCSSITMVLLVGGFAESSLLYDEVRDGILCVHNSADKPIEVKRSTLPIFSVVKGAVIFGQYKEIIRSRVMKKSVGVEACVEFCEDEHDKKYLKESGGEKYCEKAFFPLVKANDSVYTGMPAKYLFRPLTDEQQVCTISLYESLNRDVKYTDEGGCTLMGKIDIDIPKCTSDLSREIQLIIDFVKTEYDVSACSVSNDETKKLVVKHTFHNQQKHLPS